MAHSPPMPTLILPRFPGNHAAPRDTVKIETRKRKTRTEQRRSLLNLSRLEEVEGSRPRGLGQPRPSFVAQGATCAIRCGETPKPRMPFGEVPIKPGSANGCEPERGRERLACWRASHRAARGILARMIHGVPKHPMVGAGAVVAAPITPISAPRWLSHRGTIVPR
jgi:hypothetical protein